jgi:hypothetical protein
MGRALMFSRAGVEALLSWCEEIILRRCSRSRCGTDTHSDWLDPPVVLIVLRIVVRLMAAVVEGIRFDAEGRRRWWRWRLWGSERTP